MRTHLLAATAIIAGLSASADEARADFAGIFGGGRFSVDVTSFKGRKFQTIVPQRYDYSCGSASVATLLTYHFDRPTTERDAFEKMWKLGNQERIRREGFSLLEMKRYLESLGYKADGFKVEISEIGRFGLPSIVMIQVNGYKHFVVVKGMQDGWALVGDPALGLRKWKLSELEEAQAGDVVFVIHSNEELGQRHFNAENEWALTPKAPFGNALDRDSLASFSVMLPGFNEFY